jgi:hypothetical protein
MLAKRDRDGAHSNLALRSRDQSAISADTTGIWVNSVEVRDGCAGSPIASKFIQIGGVDHEIRKKTLAI